MGVGGVTSTSGGSPLHSASPPHRHHLRHALCAQPVYGGNMEKRQKVGQPPGVERV